eukprot:scaffold39459_cov31-Phaeocystis_antarctica.AAC.1
MTTSSDLQSGCCAAASSAATSKCAAVAAATKARMVAGLCCTEAEMSTVVRRGVTSSLSAVSNGAMTCSRYRMSPPTIRSNGPCALIPQRHNLRRANYRGVGACVVRAQRHHGGKVAEQYLGKASARRGCQPHHAGACPEVQAHAAPRTVGVSLQQVGGEHDTRVPHGRACAGAVRARTRLLRVRRAHLRRLLEAQRSTASSERQHEGMGEALAVAEVGARPG